MEREAVTLHLPTWLLEEAFEALEERIGRLEDGDLEAAIQEFVQSRLERLSSSGPYGPEADDLAYALRAVRRIGRKKRMAAAATTATAR